MSLAQLDRVPDSDSVGRGFESPRMRQKQKPPQGGFSFFGEAWGEANGRSVARQRKRVAKRGTYEPSPVGEGGPRQVPKNALVEFLGAGLAVDEE